MATENDITVTRSWVDATVANSALASVDVRIQNVSASGQIFVVEGGASAPTNKTGTVLDPRDSVQVNSDHIWIKGTVADKASATLV